MDVALAAVSDEFVRLVESGGFGLVTSVRAGGGACGAEIERDGVIFVYSNDRGDIDRRAGLIGAGARHPLDELLPGLGVAGAGTDKDFLVAAERLDDIKTALGDLLIAGRKE